jgi:hypothetical protein
MQIKKHISFILAFLILFSNIGLAINVHFCKDKLAAISSVFAKEEVCEMNIEATSTCCAKEISHKKCCSDKEVTIKDQSEKQVVKNDKICFNTDFVFSEIETTHFTSINLVLTSQNTDYYCDANAPPFYKLYCQFTLFG